VSIKIDTHIPPPTGATRSEAGEALRALMAAPLNASVFIRKEAFDGCASPANHVTTTAKRIGGGVKWTTVRSGREGVRVWKTDEPKP
jgi:hypothetical protein